MVSHVHTVDSRYLARVAANDLTEWNPIDSGKIVPDSDAFVTHSNCIATVAGMVTFMSCASWTSMACSEYQVSVQDCDQWVVCLRWFNLSVRAQSDFDSMIERTCAEWCPEAWSSYNLEGIFVESLFRISAIYFFIDSSSIHIGKAL